MRTGYLVQGRNNLTATLLPDGTVLVAGGNAYGSIDQYVPLASCELYDHRTGLWTPTGSMTMPRDYHTATLLTTGDVLVVSGASAELYHPASRSWTPTGNLTADHAGHTATLLPDGTVLVAGNGTADLYHPQTGTWTATAPMLTRRSQAVAALLSDGTVLVAGGFNQDYNGRNNTYLPFGEIYHPATGMWTATGPMVNSARIGATATLLATGRVLVAAGDSYPSSAELYDPATGTWAPTGSMHISRAYHTVTVLPGGLVLAAGGYSEGQAVPEAELYNYQTGQWTVTGPMEDARYWDAAVLLPNGAVLVAGGAGDRNSPAHLASAELYDDPNPPPTATPIPTATAPTTVTATSSPPAMAPTTPSATATNTIVTTQTATPSAPATATQTFAPKASATLATFALKASATPATRTRTAVPSPMRTPPRPCRVVSLFLYGSRFSFDGRTFYTLPTVDVSALRSTGGRAPRVTSPRPLRFDDGRIAFYADTRYRSLACGETTLVDLAGRVFIGSASGRRGSISLYGRTFRLRVGAMRGGYIVRLDIDSLHIDRRYRDMRGTIAVRW